MNQAKAATVMAALVNAGYVPAVSADGNGNWTIVISVSGGVAASTAAAFASSQAIVATVSSVTFT